MSSSCGYHKGASLLLLLEHENPIRGSSCCEATEPFTKHLCCTKCAHSLLKIYQPSKKRKCNSHTMRYVNKLDCQHNQTVSIPSIYFKMSCFYFQLMKIVSVLLTGSFGSPLCCSSLCGLYLSLQWLDLCICSVTAPAAPDMMEEWPPGFHKSCLIVAHEG